MGRRSDIDWDAIEREHRLGQKSNKQLAAEHGVQASTIGRRAEKYEWVQDKAAEVRARADNMLLKATAKASGNAIGRKQSAKATPDGFEIRAAATVRVDVVLGHRKGLGRIAIIRDTMLDEIEAQTSQIDLLTQIVEVARDPGENGVDKRNDLLQRIIALPSRVDSLKKLTEIDEKVRKGEREAFSIEAQPSEQTDPLASLLASMGRSTMPVVHDVPPDDDEAAAP
jgi:hypothetical protein